MEGHKEMQKFLCGLEHCMFCLFTEIYWSVYEVILKQYWKVLYSDFEEISNRYYFSNIYVFTVTIGEMANAIAKHRSI
jgi:hypothetical protein